MTDKKIPIETLAMELRGTMRDAQLDRFGRGLAGELKAAIDEMQYSMGALSTRVAQAREEVDHCGERWRAEAEASGQVAKLEGLARDVQTKRDRVIGLLRLAKESGIILDAEYIL